MDDLTAAEQEAYFALLAEKGKDRVKYELEHGDIPPALVHPACEWLSSLDAVEKRRATITRIIAVISLIVNVIGMPLSYWLHK